MNFLRVVDGIIERRLQNLHTSLMATVIAIRASGRIDAQPVNSKYPLLQNMPAVVHHGHTASSCPYGGLVVTPYYNVGDKVLVVFTERDMGDQSTRKHSLSDGVVVGKVGG